MNRTAVSLVWLFVNIGLIAYGAKNSDIAILFVAWVSTTGALIVYPLEK